VLIVGKLQDIFSPIRNVVSRCPLIAVHWYGRFIHRDAIRLVRFSYSAVFLGVDVVHAGSESEFTGHSLIPRLELALKFVEMPHINFTNTVR